MYKLTLLPLAKEDIKQAAKWYNEKQRGLGKRFIKEVRKSVSYIKQNPKLYNIRYEQTRTSVLNVFPFMIHYYLEDETNTILIVAVLHTSRNPKNWKKR